MSKAPGVVKRIILGRPMASGEMEHTLLPKVIALPVFSSDALSSVAYATQEIMLVLGAAGALALSRTFPVAIAVALLLAMVITSYRQTVRAYPQGGGAYRVSRENIGSFAGVLAGSALLLDYILTVAVSVVAGVDAIVSAAPGTAQYQVALAITAAWLVALANLRGVKESGVLFAVPTYGFVVCIFALIGSGLVKCIGGCPESASAAQHLEVITPLSFFVMLRAFAAGTTALTGVEAISDGVPAFRYPQSKNAAATLAIMGCISISMFLGISWLAQHLGVRHDHHSEVTVVADIAQTVFGDGLMFYVTQVATAAILFLAANTAFADFPRLSSILAQDRYMPRQFMNRGDRLVFSNGILILAGFASLLIYIFDSDLNRLIQLYLVGVFVSFTLSQAGMVLRSRRVRQKGWRRTAIISGIGALTTAVVLCVVIATKFTQGAWIVCAAIPVLMFVMYSIHKHYGLVNGELTSEERIPADRRPGHQRMVLLVDSVDAATARAVGYVRSIPAAEVIAITFDPSVSGAWHRLAPEIELIRVPGRGSRTRRIVEYVRTKRKDLSSDDFLTFVIPEILRRRSLVDIFLHPRSTRLKARLLREVGVQVLDVPVVREDIDPSIDQAHVPGRNYVCVLVSAVHNSTLLALEYAETLSATDVRAVTFGLDPEGTAALSRDWLEAGIPHPLEIEDSPFRDIGRSLTNYIRQFRPNGVDRVVTVILPEFVVAEWRHQVLHGQTALIVKRHLLFEPGVIVVSVPYHLEN